MSELYQEICSNFITGTFFQEFTQPLQISLFFQSDGAGGVSEPKFMLESSNFEMVNSKYVRAHHMVSLIPKFSICNLFFRKKMTVILTFYNLF